MGLLGQRYNKPGPGIEKDAPRKKGLALFSDILVREFFELIKLNLLFVLFCIPLVTIPAAVCAMSRITVTMVRDEPHFMWTDFWKAFKENFKKATLAGLLLGVGLVVCFLAARFYLDYAGTMVILFIPMSLSLLMLVLLAGMGIYVFPMLALIDLRLKIILKNALLMVLVCLPHTLLSLLAAGALLLAALLYFPYTLIAIVLLLFSLTNLITTFGAYGGMKKYVILGEMDGE